MRIEQGGGYAAAERCKTFGRGGLRLLQYKQIVRPNLSLAHFNLDKAGET